MVGVCGAFRLLAGSLSLRIIAFLAFWLVVGVLPAYQIWDISPNLVGGRLFFLSSAPFAILIPFLALPAIDSLNVRAVKIISCVGSIALLLILSIWSFWLQFDIQSFTGAGESLQSFKKQLVETISRTPDQKLILLLNLPTDYSGAGMITRPRYLQYILSPPVSSCDFSLRVITFDPSDERLQKLILSRQNRDAFLPAFNYSKVLNDILKQNNSIGRVLIWHDAATGSDTGFFSTWRSGAKKGNSHFLFNFKSDTCKYIDYPAPPGRNSVQLHLDKLLLLPVNHGSDWTIVKEGGSSFMETETGLRIRPGSAGVVLVFPPVEISPLQSTGARLKINTISGQLPQMSLLWAQTGYQEKAQSSVKEQAPTFAKVCCSDWIKTFSSLPLSGDDTQMIKLGESRTWAVTPAVGTLALHLPGGDYEVELRQLELF